MCTPSFSCGRGTLLPTSPRKKSSRDDFFVRIDKKFLKPGNNRPTTHEKGNEEAKRRVLASKMLRLTLRASDRRGVVTAVFVDAHRRWRRRPHDIRSLRRIWLRMHACRHRRRNVAPGRASFFAASRQVHQRSRKSGLDPSCSPGSDPWSTEASPTMTSILSAEHGCPCVIFVSAVRKVAGDRKLLSKLADYFLGRPATRGSHRLLDVTNTNRDRRQTTVALVIDDPVDAGGVADAIDACAS
jgi:hypothetical protein